MTAKQQTVLDWARARLNERCGYIMGATGQNCTLAFRQAQAKQFASYNGDPNYGQNTIMKVGAKWDGKRVYDCQGFVRRAYETIGVSLRSGATTQYNEAKKSYARVGSVGEMPAGGIPGAQVWRQSKTNAAVMNHTGICAGNGEVIEAEGTNPGVVLRKNLSTYQFYGVPQGLMVVESVPPTIDNEVKVPVLPNVPEVGNEYTIGRTVKGGVNMRETPGGNYMLKVPEFADVEISEYAEIDGKRFGRTTFAAPTGKYKGDLYTGWIDLQFVTIEAEGETLVPPNPSNPEYIVWTTLKANGLSNNAVAGIMGNIYAESGFIANNLQNTGNKALNLTDDEYTVKVDVGSYTNFVDDRYGYGLCQWTHSSRKSNLLAYARTEGTSIGDITMQLRFLWNEMQSYKTMMSVLLNPNVTLREASDSFMCDFERPANQTEANKQSRAAHGQRYYDKYAA